MNGTIGAITPNTGAFTSITASTTATITGNASAGNITASGAGGQLIGYHTGAIGANVANTGVFTSVATVSGGQLSGYFTGAIGANVANTGAFTSITASTTATITGNATVGNLTASGAGGQVIGYLTGAIGANVANTGAFTSVATVNGGQLSGYFTGAIGANVANTGAFTTLTSSGITTVTNNTDAVGLNTGAFRVTGGGSIGGNLWVGGNLYVSNVISTSYATLAVQDPLLYLTANVTFPYNYDIGFYSQFTGGTANAYGHTGLVRNNGTNTWILFSNIASEPGITVNFNDAGIIYDTLRLGGLQVSNTTAASSTTTGALTVSGGVGIAGAAYVGGGIQSSPIGNATASTGRFTTLTATTQYDGAVFGPMNGTIGATTPNTGAFTSITASTTATITGNASAGNITASGAGGQLIGYHTGAIGAGGASGGVLIKYINVVPGQTTATYTVGLGGTASTGNVAGQNGTSTTVVYNGVTYTAGAGNGGSTAAVGTAGQAITTSGGDINMTGFPGDSGGTNVTNITQTGYIGTGGNTPLGWGQGGRMPQAVAGANGTSGTGYGAGGSGGRAGTSATSRNGGHGNNGMVLFEW